MANKFIYHLKWVNQDEFDTFLDQIKETHNSSESFEEWFTFKFSDGSEQKFRFLFNQEDGFCFT